MGFPRHRITTRQSGSFSLRRIPFPGRSDQQASSNALEKKGKSHATSKSSGHVRLVGKTSRDFFLVVTELKILDLRKTFHLREQKVCVEIPPTEQSKYLYHMGHQNLLTENFTSRTEKPEY